MRPINERTKWVSYERVSTAEQADRELSLLAQHQAIVEFATRHGAIIERDYVEAGASGTDPQRPVGAAKREGHAAERRVARAQGRADHRRRDLGARAEAPQGTRAEPGPRSGPVEAAAAEGSRLVRPVRSERRADRRHAEGRWEKRDRRGHGWLTTSKTKKAAVLRRTAASPTTVWLCSNFVRPAFAPLINSGDDFGSNFNELLGRFLHSSC